MVGSWVSSYCLNVEGFPRILHATLQKLGVKDRPEYESHEYEKHGTERCEVTIYIGKSEEFPDITEAWSVTEPGLASPTPTRLWPAKPCNTFASSMKIPLPVPP